MAGSSFLNCRASSRASTRCALGRRRLAVGRQHVGLVDQEADEVLAMDAGVRRGGNQGFLDLDGTCIALEGLGPTSSIDLHLG